MKESHDVAIVTEQYERTRTLPRIEVICGPMFSGKSEELIRRIRRALYADLSVCIYKPERDTRTNNYIYTRAGMKMDAISVSSSKQLYLHYLSFEPDVVAIDEGQFFDDELPSYIEKIARKATVIVSGLDMDFKREPFGPMPHLMAIADSVTKLSGVCMKCRKYDAVFTQRLINGQPAPSTSPQIMVGDSESYECRCRFCHEIGD